MHGSKLEVDYKRYKIVKEVKWLRKKILKNSYTSLEAV